MYAEQKNNDFKENPLTYKKLVGIIKNKRGEFINSSLCFATNIHKVGCIA